jgi:SP family myo-inositol transporter-like MFS transporter 13
MHRGRIVAVQSVLITGGQLCAYAVSAGLDKVHNGWRILFALALPFALGQGLAMHWGCPETPRFDILNGNIDGARKTLAKIYPRATTEQLEMKLKAIELATEVSTSLKKKYPSLLGRIWAVCTTPSYLRCTVAAAVVFLGQQLSGWNSFL